MHDSFPNKPVFKTSGGRAETPTTTLTECVHTTRHTTLLIPFHTSGPGFPVPSRASTAMLPHCPPGAMRHLARRMALGLVGGDAVVPRVLDTSRGVDAHHPSHDHFAPVPSREDDAARLASR